MIIYNTIAQNNREIDSVHKYIATVSIMQKAFDRIKTALRFWFNAKKRANDVKTKTFVTSIYAIVMERYVN